MPIKGLHVAEQVSKPVVHLVDQQESSFPKRTNPKGRLGGLHPHVTKRNHPSG